MAEVEPDAAANAGTGRRHEAETADFYLRSKYKRTSIIEEQRPVKATPLLEGGGTTVRAWMGHGTLADPATNREAARKALVVETQERWKGAEITRIRKTQRRYDAQARQFAHESIAVGAARACRITAV